MNYILQDKTPIKCDDIVKWAQWYEGADRCVKRSKSDDISVSTIFLGLDHNYEETGAPVLFETMIFGGDYDEYCERYTTWDEAETGHAKACEIAGVDNG